MTSPRATLRKTILKILPETVKVENDNIAVGRVWMLKPPKDLPKPCWMVQLGQEVDMTRGANEYEEGSIITPEIANEQHAVPSTEAITNLEEWDIATVSSVKATVLGVPDTVLAAGVDYEVVDSDGDGALDGIRWLARRPDHDTVAIVTYTHRMWETTRAHLLNSFVMVHMVADKLAAGKQGATKGYDPQEILDAMQHALRIWFIRDLRPALEAAGISLNLTITIDTPLKLDGTSTLQAVGTFDTFYDTRIAIGQVRTARKATSSVDLEYPA